MVAGDPPAVRIVEANVTVERIAGGQVSGYAATGQGYIVVERDGRRTRLAVEASEQAGACQLDGECEFAQGAYDATRYLVELGHWRIACITGPQSPSRSSDRLRGYERALSDAGLAPDPALVVAGDWTYRSGCEAARQLLRSPAPTAILACNDAMAVGVLSFLHEQGLRVPEDMSVAGYDNIALSAFSCPPLTTLATPILEVGQCLCELLLARISGHLPPEPQRIVIRGELLVRGSTAALKL